MVACGEDDRVGMWNDLKLQNELMRVIKELIEVIEGCWFVVPAGERENFF